MTKYGWCLLSCYEPLVFDQIYRTRKLALEEKRRYSGYWADYKPVKVEIRVVRKKSARGGKK